MSKLLPCPFCGGSNISIKPRSCTGVPHYFQAECDECGASSHGSFHLDKEGAGKEWNTRALAAKRETGAHVPAGIADAPETPAEMVSEIVRLRSDLAKARASVEEQKTSAGNVIHKLHAERDQATRDVVSLEREVIRLKAALRSVATQCGNVIYNCEQRPADNERHLSSWRGVKEFADASCSVPSTGLQVQLQMPCASIEEARTKTLTEIVQYLESEGHGIPAEKVRAAFDAPEARRG
jgi:Lar family restriction alleviation protein